MEIIATPKELRFGSYKFPLEKNVKFIVERMTDEHLIGTRVYDTSGKIIYDDSNPEMREESIIEPIFKDFSETGELKEGYRIEEIKLGIDVNMKYNKDPLYKYLLNREFEKRGYQNFNVQVCEPKEREYVIHLLDEVGNLIKIPLDNIKLPNLTKRLRVILDDEVEDLDDERYEKQLNHLQKMARWVNDRWVNPVNNYFEKVEMREICAAPIIDDMDFSEGSYGMDIGMTEDYTVRINY